MIFPVKQWNNILTSKLYYHSTLSKLQNQMISIWKIRKGINKYKPWNPNPRKYWNINPEKSSYIAEINCDERKTKGITSPQAPNRVAGWTKDRRRGLKRRLQRWRGDAAAPEANLGATLAAKRKEINSSGREFWQHFANGGSIDSRVWQYKPTSSSSSPLWRKSSFATAMKLPLYPQI